MKKTTTPYLPFEQVVYRSPLLPFNTFINYLSEISVSDERFKDILANTIIQEAIYLASPVLFDELQKYLKKGLSDKKEEERIKYSLMRYLSRMSTRCTPFGLFAGCSVGSLADHTQIVLKKTTDYQRHTRLDMSYLCALAQDLAASPTLKMHLKYFSNTSTYRFGQKIRYVEYFYQGTRRVHRIAAVDYSEYLDKILCEAAHGKKISELAELIVDEEITMEDASEFIDELISSQLLVNEMEPSVTGEEFLQQAISKFGELENSIPEKEYVSNSLQLLRQINSLLETIDSGIVGDTLSIYGSIISEIKKLKINFEPKYLFQTDMVKPAATSLLGKTIINDLQAAIQFFNQISTKPGNTNLSKFREAFRERYEDREMPLLQVLDLESGIGYAQTTNAGDINPLIDDLMIAQQGVGGEQRIVWNRLQSVLLEKYMEAKATYQSTIELSAKDFENLTPQWDDLPLTLSAMFRVLKDDENGREIYLKSIGGTSAANLLGRFCYADKQIEELVLKITQKEEELIPDMIFAEIAHLPESRTGNILLRPVLRKYEIPYLTKPGVEKENQIALSDLMVSVNGTRIRLRSKRLDKEIIPRLSSAHNYSFNSMPVYHFLCDMQLQNGCSGLGFSWGALANEYAWLPRVKYGNVIVSAARWTIKLIDIETLMQSESDQTLLESFTRWRNSLQMPKYVVLDDGDNELFVDLTNPLSIRTLFSVVKKRNSFLLEEFLYHPETAVVKGEEGVFTNEFIVSLYKAAK